MEFPRFSRVETADQLSLLREALVVEYLGIGMGRWRLAAGLVTVAFGMAPAHMSPTSSGVPAGRVAERWVAAVNSRDAEALVRLADPSVRYCPTVLAGGPRTYEGHQGLREWIADLTAALPVHSIRISEVRRCPSGDVVVLGQLLLAHDPVSPFTLRLGLNNGLVVDGHAYLSDDELLRKLGLTERLTPLDPSA